MKKKIWIYPLIIMGMLLMLTYSCKKKDDNNNNNNNNNTPPITTVTDIDGNVYHADTIGTQIWMVENLKTTKYRDGTVIPIVTDNDAWFNTYDGAYCNYNNLTSNGSTYGHLYNWYAVTNSRKLAPTGWHIPSDAEWTTLINYLGGEYVAGGKLKESGITHWVNPNTGATNEAGFTALPGGNRSVDGTFGGIGNYGHWWSSTEYDATSAWYQTMDYSNITIMKSVLTMETGFSVRCVKD